MKKPSKKKQLKTLYTVNANKDIDAVFDKEFTEENEYRMLEKLEDKSIIKYRCKTIVSGNQIECEVYPIWNCNNSTRGMKQKTSSNAQKRLNKKNAVKNVVRLVNANFVDGDVWGTFTYEQSNMPKSMDEAQKEMAKFIRRLKGYIKKNDLQELKYIYVTEISKKGRVHHHFVCNFRDRNVLEGFWKKGKRNQTRVISADENGYEGLARYIAKDIQNGNQSKRYVCSKNLTKPKITVSDCKINRKKIKQLLTGKINARSLFEKMYQDKVEYISHYGKVSSFVVGAYVYAKMKRRN